MDQDDASHRNRWNEIWKARRTAEANHEYFLALGDRFEKRDKRLRMGLAALGACSLLSLASTLKWSSAETLFRALAAATGVVSAFLPWLGWNAKAFKYVALGQKWALMRGDADRALFSFRQRPDDVPDAAVDDLNRRIALLIGEETERPDDVLFKEFERRANTRHKEE